MSCNASVFSAEQNDPSHSKIYVTFISFLIFFLFLETVVANFLVLYVFYRRTLLLTRSNKFIFNLTVCNVMNAFCVMPFLFVTGASQCWIFGDVLCQMVGFLTTAIFAASTLTLFVISIDRYYAVTSPLHYRRKITKRRANAMVATVWLLANCCALPPVLGWNKYGYQWEKLSCTVYWRSSAYKDKYYTLFLTTLTFIIPLLAMTWVYIAMYKAASANSERTRRNSLLAHRGSYDSTGSTYSSYKIGESRGSVVTELLFQRRFSTLSKNGIVLWRRDEWKTAITSVLVVSSFVICWLPYFVIITLETLVFDFKYTTNPIVQQTVICLAVSSSGLNPLIYVFRSDIVRRELQRVFRKNTSRTLTALACSEDDTVDSINTGAQAYYNTITLLNSTAPRDSKDNIADFIVDM